MPLIDTLALNQLRAQSSANLGSHALPESF